MAPALHGAHRHNVRSHLQLQLPKSLGLEMQYPLLVSLTIPPACEAAPEWLCVTGAGQGIGRAFAHALGEAGASVAVVDINVKKAQVVTEELRSKGIRSIAVGTDVTKKADCKKYCSLRGYGAVAHLFIACLHGVCMCVSVTSQTQGCKLLHVQLPSMMKASPACDCMLPWS